MLACRVDRRDHLFVRDRFDFVVAEDPRDLGAVGGGAGSVVFGDEGQFRVHGDERAHVDGAVDGGEDVSENFELRGVGLDGFNAGGGLERIGGVDDEDPVAMAEERHGFGYARFPVGLSRKN